MKPLFHCEIEYFDSQHLSQVFEGFYRLAQKKAISISVARATGNPTKPILRVKSRTDSSKTFVIYYDTLDGFNWLDNTSIKENLLYFQNNFNADFYFKRSFNNQILEFAPENCIVLPLGLNYFVESRHNFTSPLQIKPKKYIKRILPKKYCDGVLYAEDFEYPPFYNNESKVLFLTRLWDPKDIEDSRLKTERKALNDFRIECIEACQKEFGRFFTGGLIGDALSRHHAKHLIASNEITNRSNYIEAIRSHNICVATTGLHRSIGWKFAEYIAGSRAIVSEPLHYIPSGALNEKDNYYEFKSKDELLNNIHKLLEDGIVVRNMMYNNFIYYNLFVRPENLVLNTLLVIFSEKTE